jgi:hypothetical protein
VLGVLWYRYYINKTIEEVTNKTKIKNKRTEKIRTFKRNSFIKILIWGAGRQALKSLVGSRPCKNIESPEKRRPGF